MDTFSCGIQKKINGEDPPASLIWGRGNTLIDEGGVRKGGGVFCCQNWIKRNLLRNLISETTYIHHYAQADEKIIKKNIFLSANFE